ncbi:MAG: rhomboid family intramembrane serine protease [Bacteroidetes bacterium]|nr:rhomboid family intramembrane serine protease [Bacteroidota bacterium]
MLPIGDDNTDRRILPVVNIAFIVINVVVFVFLQGLGSNTEFTYAYAAVPQEILTGTDIDTPVLLKDIQTGEELGHLDLQPTPISIYLTLLTSMFMHGGFMHIAGNMLYLWIFGDNIEDRLGHARYFMFYIVVGVLAALAHVFSTVAFGGNPYIPMVGASGAISGVLGGYLLLFPRKRVRVIMFNMLTEVPAIIAIGLWFLFQVISGAGAIGSHGGGVAYAAHIGGFIAGLVLVKLFAASRREPDVFVGRIR